MPTPPVSTEEYHRLRNKGKENLTEGNFQKAVEYYSRAIVEAERLGRLENSPFSQEFASQQIRLNCNGVNGHDRVTCQFCSIYLELAVCFANRSLSHCNLKEYKEALKDAEDSIALAPEWPKSFFRKAEALIGLENFEEAKIFYLQVINLEPVGSPSHDLLKMKILNADLLQEAKEHDLYFRPLIPGENICIKTWNPISKLIFEFAKKMRNVVYVIGDQKSKECVIVDPCWDVDGIIKEVCKEDGMRIVGVIATHNHFDHVGGRPPAPFDSYGVNVNGVAKLLEKFPEISARIHRLDADLLQSEAFVSQDRIIILEDGDKMIVGRHEIEFHHTPGHTPGSQCIRFGPGMRRVLTGDTLFCGSCGRVDFPGGDIRQLYSSLFNIINAWPEDTVLFPAHSYGGKLMTTVWYERRHGIFRFRDISNFAARLGVDLSSL